MLCTLLLLAALCAPDTSLPIEERGVPLPYLEPGALPNLDRDTPVEEDQESSEPTYEDFEIYDAPNPYPEEDENLVS